MSQDHPIEFGTVGVSLDPLPIRAEWVLEGSPTANAKIISRSSDGTARTLVWDCSAGRFNWFYDIDETVYVIEGSARIKNEAGETKLVSAGDTILFRAGSKAEWTVEKYIRKIAFFRNPVPKYALLAISCMRAAQRLTGFGRAKATGPMLPPG